MVLCSHPAEEDALDASGEAMPVFEDALLSPVQEQSPGEPAAFHQGEDTSEGVAARAGAPIHTCI